jgi:formate hydrogenlyase subunit 3/multisubunit Na+/H+ antiporter MnhD subunit
MTRIINPFWIYLAGIANTFKTWLVILSVFFFLISVFSFVFYMFHFDEEYDTKLNDEELKELRKPWGKTAKKGLITLIFLIILNTITPNKETLYTMIVFDTLTVENITAAGETGKEIVDYVIDSVDNILNKEKDDKRE